MSFDRSLPRVSVVVPVYNGALTLDACLASLVALDYPRERFEIIAVDNGSTDGTAEILRAYAGRVRPLHEASVAPPPRATAASAPRASRSSRKPMPTASSTAGGSRTSSRRSPIRPWA
jgi:glycosyltransferase involved in cell wall biosynthesis